LLTHIKEKRVRTIKNEEDKDDDDDDADIDGNDY